MNKLLNEKVVHHQKRPGGRFSLTGILLALFLALSYSPASIAQYPPLLVLDGLDEITYAQYGYSAEYISFNPMGTATATVVDDVILDSTHVWVMWMINKTFNDNSYGNSLSKHPSWPQGHNFGDLLESDKQTLEFVNACGDSLLVADFGLIDHDKTVGKNDDESALISGSWSQLEFDTSTAANFKSAPYPAWADTSNSPVWANPPGTDYVPSSPPHYEYRVMWEFRIERSLFTAGCPAGLNPLTYLRPYELHASPNKLIDTDNETILLRQNSTIGDTVYFDTNRNNIQDATEAGIPNVTVALYNAAGWALIEAGGSISPLYTSTTDGQGLYLFDKLGAGDYMVVITDENNQLDPFVLIPPAGTTSNIFAPDGKHAVTLGVREKYKLADFGYALANPSLGIIGDLVYSDANNNGIHDAGEPGIGGVTIELTYAGPDGDLGTTGDNITSTTTTEADGSYLFYGLVAGSYQVDVTDTAGVLGGYSLVVGQQGKADPYGPISLGTGDIFTEADFGYYRAGLGTIGDLVWYDQDEDGVFDAAESPIANVGISLYQDANADGLLDSSDFLISNAWSDSTGHYSFNGLSLDDGGGDARYLVEVTDTLGVLDTSWLLTLGTPGANNNSQATPYPVTLNTAGTSSNQTADFGYVSPAGGGNDLLGVVGDTLFYDRNLNGIQDSGEAGIADVVVELWRVKQDKFLGYVLTDDNGNYVFPGLDRKEEYFVIVADSSTRPNGGNGSGIDNFATGGMLEGFAGTNQPDNRDEETLILNDGNDEHATDLTLDFGYWFPTTLTLVDIGDTVFLDRDGDGTQTPAGADGDLGTVSDNEFGIIGVTLDLYDSDNQLLSSTTTASDGTYLFQNLPEGETFTVMVTDVFRRLTGYAVTTGSNSHTHTMTTVDYLDADFGYKPPTAAALGDRLWADLDGDGVQDAGEAGIAGVTVVLTKQSGTPVATTTTSSVASDIDLDGTVEPVGSYYFAGLTPGTYKVEFLLTSQNVVFDSTTCSGNLSNCFDITVQNNGSDLTDSDANVSGLVSNISLGVGEYDESVDAGLVPLGEINGWVTFDKDGGADIDEPASSYADQGIGGVVIQLWRDTDGNGTPDILIRTTTTNADMATDANGDGNIDAEDIGYYEFTRVPVGDYVLVEKQPDNFVTVVDYDFSAEDPDAVALANDATQNRDNRVPVALAFAEQDAANTFLETTNSTTAIDDDNVTLIYHPVTGSVTFNDFDLQGDTQTITTWLVDSDGDGRADDPVSLGSTHSVYGTDESMATVVAGTLALGSNGFYTFVPCESAGTPVGGCVAAFTGRVKSHYLVQDDFDISGTPLPAFDKADLAIWVTPYVDPVDGTSNRLITHDDDKFSYGDPVSDNVLNNDVDPENRDPFAVISLLADTDGDGEADDAVSLNSTTDVYGLDADDAPVMAGTIILLANGNYTFTPCTGAGTPDADCTGAFYGDVELVYTAEDDPVDPGPPEPNTVHDTDSATLFIQVENETDEVLSLLATPPEVNDPPFASDDLLLTFMNTDQSGNVLNNDEDPNGDTLNLMTAGTGIPTLNGGTIDIAANGSVTYHPPTDYIGPDRVSYQVCDVTTVDPQPLCDVATVYLAVLPVLDFGDLPETLTPPGLPPQATAWGVRGHLSARHYVRPGLRLGLLLSAEINGSPSSLTDGDGAEEDGASFAAIGYDDGDGVVEPELGETAYYKLGVLVQNDTGTDAALVGYIDWNCDGVLEEPEERARVIVNGDGDLDTDNNPGTLECDTSTYPYCVLEWGTYNGTTPLMSAASIADCSDTGGGQRTYARLRLTTEPEFFTDNSPSPNGRAKDGEIEDYNITTSASTTPAIVTGFTTTQHVDGGAVVSFATASELGTVAFRLERLSTGPDGRWQRVHDAAWIPSRLELQGSDYRVYDAGAVTGERSIYRLIEKTRKGRNLTYGPYEVVVAAGSEQLDTAVGFSVDGHFDLDAVTRNLDTRAAAKDKIKGKPKTGDMLRILVDQTGIHSLTSDELQTSFGATARTIERMLRTGQLHLTSGGQDVAWFAHEDALYFYGQGSDNLFSNTRTYWLTLGVKGELMAETTVKKAALSSDSFIDTRDHEEDSLWWLSLSTDPDSDYWFWNILSPFTPVLPFNLPVPGAQAVDGELTLRLWGASDAEHLLTVRSAAGDVLGTVNFTGNSAYTTPVPLTIPAALFTSETLALEIQLEASPTGAYSAVLVDGFEVSWQRALAADAGALKYPGAGATSVSGFAGNKLVTMDVFDPANPLWITGGRVRSSGGGYAWSAKLPASEYATADVAQVLKPVLMELDIVSKLTDKKNRADYVVITQVELMDAALALAEYRDAGLRTMVVDIQDIYDEFSHGEPLPTAINAFAKASQEWKTPARYMAILGDGSFDYRDIMGTGYNFVSPVMYGTSNGLFASDTLQGDLDGDGIPEVAFGRIPVKSNEEGLAYVAKLQAYEAGIGDLPNLLLTDKSDKGGDFAYSQFQVQQQLAGVNINIDLKDKDIVTARSELDTEIDHGVRMINYLGHGGMDRVSAKGLIINGDEATMDNTITPSFVGLSCLINNFSVPGWDGLGERLVVQPDAGMVVSWAASGESYNDQATEIGVEFHTNQGSYYRLGDAIIGTFQARPFLVPIYTLIGDPALLMQ